MKKYISAIIILLALGVSAFILLQKENSTTTDIPPQNATTTEQVANATDIFSQPPIIPKAKVSTEGWKTCRNEEYGYEFKFPPEWHIYGADALGEPNALGKRNYVMESKECNGASVGLSEMSIEDYKNGDVVSKRGIGIEVRYNNLTTTEYLRKYILSQRKKKSEIHNLMLDDHTSILQVYSHTSLYNGQSWRVRTVLNNKEYWLSGNFYDEQKDIIETILSTFHFLNTSTSTKTTTQ